MFWETTGLPSPGETALITAGAYAATLHGFSIVLVVASAASAAILGDNIGFWIGREGGWRSSCSRSLNRSCRTFRMRRCGPW
jgi:membrane protein DedA with SNARE-associated domain